MKVNLTPWSPKRAIFQNAAFFGKTLVVAMLAVMSTFSMNAQTGCSCNDLVTLGLNNSPNARPTAITAKDILSNPEACGAWWIRLRQNGMWVGIDMATGLDIESTDSEPRYSQVGVDCSYKNTTVYAEILKPIAGGNFEIVCWGTVNIEDKKKPSCFIRDVTMSCDVDETPENVNEAYGQGRTSDNSSYGFPRNIDNCGPMGMTKTYADENKLNACRVGYINRTWTVTDMSGNSTTCAQKITYMDQTPPSITWPADVVLDCVDADVTPASTGEPEVSDNCANLAVEHSDATFEQCANACYKVLRTWRVLDWCKYNSQTGSGLYTHEQIIKVNDTEQPTFDLLDTMRMGISTMRGWNPNRGNVINNFTLPEPSNMVDNCGTTSYSAVLYSDENGNGEIDQDDAALPTDNQGRYDDLTCNNYIAIYSIRDCCGNSVSSTVLIVIYDDVPPVALCDNNTNLSIGYAQNPRAGRNECANTTSTNGYAEICVDAIDDGSSDNITADIDLGIAKGGAYDPTAPQTSAPTGGYRDCLSFRCSESGPQIIWLRAQDDACPTNNDDRNSGYCWMVVNIEDKNAPICTFTPPNVTVECGDDISEAALGTATFRDECELDTCWTIDESNLYCGGDITRTWYVRDGGGNVTSCSQIITVVLPDWSLILPTADISIDCANFENVNPDPSVTGQPEVVLVDSCNRVALLGPFDSRGPVVGTLDDKIVRTWDVMDWCTGDVITVSQNIILRGCRAIRNVASLGGVVTNVVGQALSGVSITTNNVVTTTSNEGIFEFYNMNTGVTYDVEATLDGNDKAGVNTLDIINTRQHILGTSTLSTEASIAADVNGDQRINVLDIIQMRQMILGQISEWTINAWAMSPAAITVDHEAENLDINFTGIKIGDVDASYDVSNRAVGTVAFNTANLTVKAGQTVTVPFNLDADVLGYQMTIQTTGLEFVSVDTDMSNFNVTANGIATSWDAFSTSSRNFSITFKATDNVELNTALRINSTLIDSEAYGRDGSINNVELTFDNNSTEFVLYQNRPNPFVGQSLVSFNLPEAMNATLTVYDVTGKILFTSNDTYTQGYNEVNVRVKATGILYYSVKAGEFTATKKMLSSN